MNKKISVNKEAVSNILQEMSDEIKEFYAQIGKLYWILPKEIDKPEDINSIVYKGYSIYKRGPDQINSHYITLVEANISSSIPNLWIQNEKLFGKWKIFNFTAPILITDKYLDSGIQFFDALVGDMHFKRIYFNSRDIDWHLVSANKRHKSNNKNNKFQIST